MKHFAVLIIISILLSNCKSKEDKNVKYVNTFPGEKKVTAKDVQWVEPDLLSGMLQIDSFLIISNYKGKNVFQVYNTNRKKMICQVGNFGKGPNEFINPMMINQYIKKDGCIYFFIWDKRKILYTIDLNKLLSGDNFIIKKEKLSTKFGIQSGLVKIDSTVLGISDESEGKTFEYNLNSQEVNLWDYYPKIKNTDTYNSYDLYLLYSGYMLYNDKRNIVVKSYISYFNQLVFYTPSGNRIRTIKLPQIDYNLTKENVIDAPSYTYYLQQGNKYIYATYDNYVDKNALNYKGLLNVFDWEGNPVVRYKIENKVISAFAVDEINGKIYGYAHESGTYLMVEFDL